MGVLKGKTAVVTGGTSGFGEETAKLWAAEGARVVVTGRDEERGKAVAETIHRSGGSIIATGSDNAYLGNRGLSVYCGTKAAVLSFCRAVAMEYADKKIRVNTVSPGAGKTPMHAELMEGTGEAWKQVEAGIPMGRSCYPEDFANTALFFAGDDSAYITGADLMVDGGWLVKGL